MYQPWEVSVSFRRTFIALTIVALPALVVAQRAPSVRGERAGDVGGRGFVMPRASDLEDHSPVGVVLDNKKKLSLADSQLNALKAIAKELHAKNASFYQMWDSVRVSMRSAAGAFGGNATGGVGGISQADQERLATARTRMAAIMRAVRDGDEWSRAETLKVLTPEQQAKAQQFWKDDEEDFGQTLPRGGRPPGA